jgi:hypothetical protein
MRHLRYHSSERRSVGPFHNLIDLLQTKAANNHLVLLRRANRTLYQFNLNHTGHTKLPAKLQLLRANTANVADCALIAELFERINRSLYNVMRIARANRFG